MAEYHLECPDECSFKGDAPWQTAATEALVAGTSFRKIVAEVATLGGRTNLASLSRHKKHIVTAPSGQDPEAPLAKATNIEILEAIIQKGFQNHKNWKPTISDTMKAMDMWFRLTQGNPFDELLDTLASAAIGEEEDDESEEANPAAVGLPDEAEDVIDPEGA